MDAPKEYPKVIYKYRNWTDEYHRNVLEKNQLYLASPKDFNDPFDCRIPTNFFLLNTKEKKQEYVNRFMARHHEKFIRNGYKIEDEAKKLNDRYENQLEEIQKEQEQILFDGQDKRYGVLSLSTRWDSILMWSHYAEFHRGYCVGFYEERMRKSEKFGAGGPVLYDRFPQIDPLEENQGKKMFQETHFKAKDWDYEKEYRLTKLFYPQLPEDADRIITIPDDFFVEIIIGLKTPETSRKQIIDLAHKKRIKVFETYKVPFEFKIDRREL